MTTNLVRLTIDVPPEFRKQLKVYAAERGKTIKQFIMESVYDYMERDKEKIKNNRE